MKAAEVWRQYLIYALVLNLLFSVFLLQFTHPDFGKLQVLSDVLDDFQVGHNLVHGKGYVVDRPVFNCTQTPCDGRFREPLYPLLLANFSSVYGAAWVTLSCFLLILLLFYLEGGWLACFAFLSFNLVYSCLLVLNIDFLYFLLFFCCMICLKEKWFKTYAIALSLLLLARFPLGLGLFAASFILVKDWRKHSWLPLMAAVFFMIVFSPNNPNKLLMFTGDVWRSLRIGDGWLSAPSLSLGEKAFMFLKTTLTYLIKGFPHSLWFLFPLVLLRALRSSEKIGKSTIRFTERVFLLTFIFTSMLYGLYTYDERYVFYLYYGLVWLKDNI